MLCAFVAIEKRTGVSAEDTVEEISDDDSSQEVGGIVGPGTEN